MTTSLEALLVRLESAAHIEVLPATSESAVAAFEAAHGLRLPDDYRRFLLEVAEGIWMDDEPALFTLDDVSQVLIADGIDPSLPFPYDDRETAALLEVAAGPREGRGLLGDPAFMALQKTGIPNGCLPLTDHGGDERCALVVTGDQRSHVWRIGQLDLPEVPGSHTAAEEDGPWEPMGFSTWLPMWSASYLGV